MLAALDTECMYVAIQVIVYASHRCTVYCSIASMYSEQLCIYVDTLGTYVQLVVRLHLPCVAPPDPQGLTSLSATPSSATSVRVSWVYSANPSTLTSSGGYRIRYQAVSPPGISDAGDVTVSRLIRSYTVYGLEEGVRYKITINAYVGSRNGVSRSTYVTTYTAGVFNS